MGYQAGMMVADLTELTVEGTRAEHWDQVYTSKDVRRVSWYQPHLATSLRLLQQYGLSANSSVIDVGGGASTLVDDLLGLGVRDVTVLDLSAQALTVAQQRLGPKAAAVKWLVGDVTQQEFPAASFDFWHDRAVLHFLTDEATARAYARVATRAVKPGGYAVVAGFAPEGPTQCSGLPVARRNAQEIENLFGPGFAMVANAIEQHQTPAGAQQSFFYAVMQRLQGK